MIPNVAVRVANLGKIYRIGELQDRYTTLRDSLAEMIAKPWRYVRNAIQRRPVLASPIATIWALKNVCFEVQGGEVVGIIGCNGAGKSTLLKILSRITEPTEGRVEICGRVGSLLEVGTGFHPELTGRENVYLNGAILGMRRGEIENKFGRIVQFAEIEKFIDTPVKRYSTGMYVRLAFSVAAHLDPEILLVDEVLSVGDAAFQQKCLGRMNDVAEGGRTVLFISHNMGAVRNLCSRVIWLDQGSVVCEGRSDEIVRRYLETTLSQTTSGLALISDRTDRQGDGKLRFISFIARVCGGNNETPRCGEDAELVLGYRSDSERQVTDLVVGIDVKDFLGQSVVSLGNHYEGTKLLSLPPRGELVCRLPKLPLQPGTYYVNITCKVSGTLADKIYEAAKFEVLNGDFFGTNSLPLMKHGTVLVPHKWSCRGLSDL